jgi:aspartate/methionine/tyrosine aminotransferase
MQLPSFKLERYFAQYEFNVKYLLCSSDCESVTIQNLLALEREAHERFLRQWLGYTESPGAPELRQEISRLYTTIQPAEVLVHTGAEEAIFLFMHAVLQLSDHVIAHSPGYQSLTEVARGAGCEVTRWQARERNGWALDLDDLRYALRPNTRVIVINTPHNPTGFLMAPEDFRAVNQIAQAKDVILFSDEAYRESEYRAADRLPAACDINDRAVSLGVMSKTYGLPGLRIGWIATHNAEIYAQMARLKDYTTICNSAPGEFLAALALRHREKLAQRNLEIIWRNLEILERFFARHQDRFAWQRPAAGPVAFPRLLGENVETFCERLVRQAGVLLAPGNLFDDYDNHFRIGFGRKNLPEAVARLEDFLNS